MDHPFLYGFLALVAVGILRGLIQARRNPWEETAFDRLPEELRNEIARVFPDFQPTRARLRKLGTHARVSGQLRGESVVIEGDFDGRGALVEFELERHQPKRTQGSITPETLPEAAKREIDRVLGDALPHFQPRRLCTGTLGDVEHFEMEGDAGEWSWEIVVDAAGHLLEVEKELRRR